MPRLPTIRVIGSQDISTSRDFSVPLDALGRSLIAKVQSPRDASEVNEALVRARFVARGELAAFVAPLRFLVHGAHGDLAQTAHHVAVDAADGRRYLRARRLVHERHELVRETGHRA